jgi:hypothetical protein
MAPNWPWRRRRGSGSSRDRATIEAELSEARGDLARVWPGAQASYSLNDAPSPEARAALERLIHAQRELDEIGEQ